MRGHAGHPDAGGIVTTGPEPERGHDAQPDWAAHLADRIALRTPGLDARTNRESELARTVVVGSVAAGRARNHPDHVRGRTEPSTPW